MWAENYFTSSPAAVTLTAVPDILPWKCYKMPKALFKKLGGYLETLFLYTLRATRTIFGLGPNTAHRSCVIVLVRDVIFLRWGSRKGREHSNTWIIYQVVAVMNNLQVHNWIKFVRKAQFTFNSVDENVFIIEHLWALHFLNSL
jgi:hypothetical protein